ncbi:uncharacterized protein LOC123668129 [Melitaea cinxia]|uniref:uncharacterized protein LOC123668129 n=1 Tax=Melitaea cinxia TaxID=113334 RepID=UPI001E2742D6|nr:uncharacterized protein LOC123668129 [Melitaea cinxia]
MPYYCTVPRCTSMAGKAKDVSFHQFPRDEDLANIWNKILKRGKPYTKYSKVCSLHFKPEDYTITSGQRNKGQWRTLRKDAIPSQNLPMESPRSYQKTDSSWIPQSTYYIYLQMQQQMAQAIYVQTMLAMQAASISALNTKNSVSDEVKSAIQLEMNNDNAQAKEYQEISRILNKDTHTFKCELCLKCFKDPDVFLLHQRCHTKSETLDTNEMLKANPILANLLKSDKPQTSVEESDGVMNAQNVKIIENQMMAAITANMENYLKTIFDSKINDNDNNYDTDSEGTTICDNEDLD